MYIYLIYTGIRKGMPRLPYKKSSSEIISIKTKIKRREEKEGN